METLNTLRAWANAFQVLKNYDDKNLAKVFIMVERERKDFHNTTTKRKKNLSSTNQPKGLNQPTENKTLFQTKQRNKPGREIVERNIKS